MEALESGVLDWTGTLTVTSRYLPSITINSIQAQPLYRFAQSSRMAGWL